MSKLFIVVTLSHEKSVSKHKLFQEALFGLSWLQPSIAVLHVSLLLVHNCFSRRRVSSLCQEVSYVYLGSWGYAKCYQKRSAGE